MPNTESKHDPLSNLDKITLHLHVEQYISSLYLLVIVSLVKKYIFLIFGLVPVNYNNVFIKSSSPYPSQILCNLLKHELPYSYEKV